MNPAVLMQQYRKSGIEMDRLPIEHIVRMIYKKYCDEVDEHYQNSTTRIMKKDAMRHSLQWVMTGTHADQNPGWEP